MLTQLKHDQVHGQVQMKILYSANIPITPNLIDIAYLMQYSQYYCSQYTQAITL